MKILFSQLIALCFCTLLLSNSPLLVAQTATQTDNNLPPSFKYKLKKQVPVLRVDMPDELVQTTNRYREMGKPISPLHTVDTTFDFMKVAVCEKLPNGDKVWRLKIESNVYLSQIGFGMLDIPIESMLYWYTDDKGSYEQLNNVCKKNRYLSVSSGRKPIILEYYLPKKSIKRGKIYLSGASLTYSDNLAKREILQDHACIPNVRCNCADYNCPSPSSSVLSSN